MLASDLIVISALLPENLDFFLRIDDTIVVFVKFKVTGWGSFFFSSRRRHTRLQGDWSSDVCSSDLDPRRRYIGNLDRVVLTCHDRLGQVPTHLLGVYVERRDELHVRDVVVAEGDVHETRDALVGVGVTVVLHALDQGRGAVTDTDDGYANGAHRKCLLLHHGRSGGSWSGVLLGWPGWPPERSVAMSSSSQRTSRSHASSPCRCSSRVYASSRSAARVSASRSPSRRSSIRRRRPSRMRSRVAWSVREKNAKCTPKPGSSNVSGPAWASSSWKRSLPSAVIL